MLGTLTEQDREWITAGMAWVMLRRWMCGQQEGDAARLWFQEQMDQRFNGHRGLQPPGLRDDMGRLEGELKRRVALGLRGQAESKTGFMHP